MRPHFVLFLSDKQTKVLRGDICVATFCLKASVSHTTISSRSQQDSDSNSDSDDDDDDDDDSESWGSDSDSSSSSDDDDNPYAELKGRAKWLKKTPAAGKKKPTKEWIPNKISSPLISTNDGAPESPPPK